MMFKRIRQFIPALIWTILLGGTVGGGYLYWMMYQSDLILCEQIRKHISSQTWGEQVEFATARFDLQGNVRIYDLQVTPPGYPEPILRLPETVLVVDRELLKIGEFSIKHLMLSQPQLDLSRSLDGKWNWQSLVFPPKGEGEKPLPEITIDEGSVALFLDRPKQDPLTILFQNLDAGLIPSGYRQFVLNISSTFEPGCPIEVEGDWSLEHSTFEIQGKIGELPIGNDLIRVMAALSPEIEDNLRNTLRKLPLKSKLLAGVRPPEEVPNPEEAPSIAEELPDTGVQAVADTYFKVGKRADEPFREYKILFNIKSGTVENPRLPSRVTDLSGRIYLNNDRILIKDLLGYLGDAEIHLSGQLLREQELLPGSIRIKARNLLVDRRLRETLPEQMKKFYDDFRPQGLAHVDIVAQYDGAGHWQWSSEMSPQKASMRPVAFPMLVEDLVGVVTHSNGLCDVKLNGSCEGRPISITGHFAGRNAFRKTPSEKPTLLSEEGQPLPNRRVRGRRVSLPEGTEETISEGFHFEIDAEDFPINESVQAAAESMRNLENALVELGLSGTADFHYVLERKGPLGAPIEHSAKVKFKNCSLLPKRFPWPLEQCSAKASWNGKDWTLEEFTGMHGLAQVSGYGSFRSLNSGEHELQLELVTQNAEFDQELRQALPEEWLSFWERVEPTGKFHSQASVHWNSGSEPKADISIQLVDAGCQLQFFPVEVQKLKGKVGISQGVITLTNIRGSRKESTIALSGSGEFFRDGSWQVHLDDFTVDDLPTGSETRQALPFSLREFVELINPRGSKISFSGEFDFKGTSNPDDPVTAAWNIQTIWSGSSLTVGVDLHQVHGRIGSVGTWDGEKVVGDVQLELDSLTFMGFQFSKVTGPVQIDGNQLVIGSKGALQGGKVALAQRVSARAIEGLFTMDGIIKLEKTPSYKVLITMNGAKLERYAQLYAPSREKLRGVMNGWVELDGRGYDPKKIKGRGKFQVRPAALYELPVILAVLKPLSFGTSDNAAFNEASADYRIERGTVQFNYIQLKGQAIELVGRGFVTFDKRVRLDFYSKSSSQGRGPIPIIGQLVGEVSKGWLGVEIRGTLEKPEAKVRPVPMLDDALKDLLGVKREPVKGPGNR